MYELTDHLQRLPRFTVGANGQAPSRRRGVERAFALLKALFVSLLLVAAATGAALVIEHYVHVPNILLVYLPVVLIVAVRFGFPAAALTSLACVAAASYFAVPVYSFAVADPGMIWALLMFVVAAYASHLAAKIEHRASAERRQTERLSQLHRFSSRLAALSCIDEIAAEAQSEIRTVLGADPLILVPKHGALRRRPRNLVPLDPVDELAANACWQYGRPAGRGTNLFPAASYRYRPLETSRGVGALLGLRREDAPELAPDEAQLLDALCDQLAVSLDRARLAEEMTATAMLAETERLRSALLSSVSHDLKTPLASILGNVTSLKRYWSLYDESTRNEMLAYAENETLRLSRFVENLLQMTRIDSGAVQPNIEAVDLADLIGAALKRTEKQTASHVVATDLPEDLPMVSLDFVLAEHALVNLIDNAAKYSPPGSRIDLSAATDRDVVRIVVRDEGPGLRSEDMKRLFERFFRAGVAERRRSGVGLGLAICKGFIEAMGGRIDAANRTDRSGAVFTISLPIATRDAERTNAARREEVE